MNQPDEQPKSVEERLADLEQLFGDIIKNEQELIKLSKRHTFNMREISGAVGNLQLDMGDVRERFDVVEQKIDRIEQKMATKEDISRIETRLDKMESSNGELLRAILARLPQPDGE